MSQDQRNPPVPISWPTAASSFGQEMHPADVRLIVTVRGQFDPSSQHRLAFGIARAVVAGRDEITFDLESLDADDIEDLGLLIRARELLRSKGQHIVIRSPCIDAAVLVSCALLDPLVEVQRVDQAPAVMLASGLALDRIEATTDA